MTDISVLVVDDHPMFREGIKSFLEGQSGLRLVGAVGTAEEALVRIQADHPDVVLLDLRLIDGSGLDVLNRAKRLAMPPKVLVVSSHDGDAMVRRALEEGADGYLSKSTSSAELVESICRVHSGARVISSQLAKKVTEAIGQPRLTERETEIIQHVAEGLSNKQVGEALGLSEKSVKNRLLSIFLKLRASDRTHAVVIAIERGFINPPG